MKNEQTFTSFRKKTFTPHFPSSAPAQGCTGSRTGLFRGSCSLGKYLLLGEYIHCLQLLQGAEIALSLLFSFSSQMDCLASSRRWLDKNLGAHFLTWLEIPRNFLTRSKHVGGFISNLQLQGSFFLLPLPFSTLTAFSQRNHHLC